MTAAIYAIIVLVALQRLGEVAYAERNTRRLLDRGGVEIGRAHYPLIVALHVAWLVAIAAFLPAAPGIHFVPLGLFAVLQALRLWVIASLGRYWTTRIITLDGVAMVRRGPYKYVRHPNYLIVAGEIALLPLSFGEWAVAGLFTGLNAAMLAWRIFVEDKALAARRRLPGHAA